MQLHIEKDPFLKYRPFAGQTDNLLLQHWHELAATVVFYSVLMLVAPKVNKRIFGDYYSKMQNKKRRLDFDIHIVAMIQSLLAIGLCVPMFAHPLFNTDPIFGTYDFAGFAASLTCGYFVWDLVYCCIFHYDIYGFQYLFHGFGALIVFTSTFAGYCQPLIPAFLIYELSTPFVNLHWFYTRGPKGLVNEKTFLLNGLLLMTTFFLSRCVWGIYVSIKIFRLCMQYKDRMPVLFIPVIFTLNIGFHILNLYWFSKMVLLATRRVGVDDRKKDY
ncbi:hypothetical protein FOA43_003356 [Brettanomyces nanus]|uniref:TLC domain-containing protein n=1 Tax=Eeniella nana TaxID=13502 RepID=A0A875RQ63_EENNA|nr:uncharacterized protein FOA43_003356 [Brettanomyces nanus]QPG75970.1 hypothetical protein FOA43_003356 [Brettanomyces nanus]